MRKNPHVRICGGLGSATTLVYPTVVTARCFLGGLMRRQLGAFGTVACLLFLPLPAVAQQDTQAEDEKLPQFTDEVTVRVTARKREETLQSVPFLGGRADTAGSANPWRRGP